MTIHYTDPSADTRFTPTASDEVRTHNQPQDNTFRGDTRTDETIVPVYARKAPKKDNKRLLMAAAPVAVAAIALGAWALMGQGEREDATGQTEIAAAEDRSTSRLMAADTAAAPLAVSETPTTTTVDAQVAAAPAPMVRPPAPAPRATASPARRAAPAASRQAAPSVRAQAAAPAAAPITPRPYEAVDVTPAPAASEPAPSLVVVPTRTLPAEPAPTATPPASPELGGQA